MDGARVSARASLTVQPRAPNPNGCYVIVYERPDYQGAGEVLNGPLRLSSLERLSETNEENWRNRIRSLRVGNSAAVTAYVDPAFAGDSRQFTAGTAQPRLEVALSGRIESLELACRQPAPP